MSKEYVRLEEVIKILESYDLLSGAIAEIKMLPTVDVDEMFYSYVQDGDKVTIDADKGLVSVERA